MYRFTPILKTLVWGTENWILSSVPGNESLVAEGPQKGKTLSQVYGGEFPLLIKFIDAGRDLSIQVHPNDDLAASRHGCKGKSEMWYVVSASPQAHLYSGLRQSISPQEYVSLVESGRITEVLADYKVKSGDVFYIPAGRIHAICAGCHIAEIQQTSDITYRIFDYNRPGLDGKPRQLHTREALDAIDYTVQEDYRSHYTAEVNHCSQVVKSPFFTTSLLPLNASFSLAPSQQADYQVLICVEGEVVVKSTEDELLIKAGESLLTNREDGTLELLAVSGEAKLLITHA